ncbi:MAG: DMT family transporter [Pseudomonadota bacterium]
MAPLPASSPARGIGLMVAAMAFMACGDMFIKLSSRAMAAGQIMICLSALGALLFIAIAKTRGFGIFVPTALHPAVIARNIAEMAGAIGMVLGLVYVPLSTYAVVIQMAPLIVTIAAALLLKERIGPRRWIAVAVGFCGMLLVVRPGLDGFTPAALLPLFGISALALRDVLTRMVPPDIPAVALSAWGFLATLPTGMVMLWIEGAAFTWEIGAYPPVIGATIATCFGYYAVIQAMRLAPASIVAPFRYTRLVFVMAVAIVVFGETPDGLTLLGAAIILAAGLYTFVRERQLARATA